MTSQTIIIISIFVICLIVYFFVRLKKNQDEIKEIIARKFTERNVHLHDQRAMLFAQLSRGYRQQRGQGDLILTDHELFFAMPFPKKIVTIPLSTITNIEKPMRVQGQSIMKPFLKVNFNTIEGKEDAYAWYVKELEQWESEILQKKDVEWKK